MSMDYNSFTSLIKNFQIEPPIDLSKIAKALELNVYESFRMPENVSGMIAKVNDNTREYDLGSGYYIVVNGKHHEHRKRFTVAHEIAHFILDHDKIGDNLIDSAMLRSNNVTEPEEVAANALAADILMPWELISSEINNGTPVNQLADRFNVSQAAMSIRLGIPLE